MSQFSTNSPLNSWNRRQFIQGSLTLLGLGLAGGTIGLRHLISRSNYGVKIPDITQDDNQILDNPFNPMMILREFDYGTIKRENGRVIREFKVVANSSLLHLNGNISFVSWNLNNRVPGPTLRAREGDKVRIIFENEDGHSHSLHFHGNHPSEMDGVKPIRHGKTAVYEFEAKPFGVHLYHCHVAPVTRHISKGLYGMFIVDPPQPRLPADEMVMVLGGYDINNARKNDLYAFNGIPNYYRDHPISIYKNQLIRLYILNMIEFDSVATFHIHGNMFKVYRTGRSLTPDEETDMITMGTAERHILEFSYDYPGTFMFHPHQDTMAEYGCLGIFNVLDT
ncbi:multicopper oxidase domain-containing protein [Crocosphaera sp. UHCC 0190]|uniref:multicopper oxidase domain-containing protein n=1 Tax=Crocosphaera sp. UHCC 0190 TaxID=3110246 RepID=UPI002B20714F|nr:multicopper oxidase domain-containing protein [Crocosphaera sp. UHCC 0190]MEA5511005.1 multicopper oxidase domain-containing protein [Crocosphaera sp. UHCC 0190]